MFLSFLVYIFLVIICLNFHFVIANFLNITLEGVQSNPGQSKLSVSSDIFDSVGSNSSASSVGLRNFALKKSILASHHQGHLKYSESTGMQCTSNAGT